MNFKSDGIEEYGSLVVPLDRGDIRFKQKKLKLHIKHRESSPVKRFFWEAPKLEVRALPPHLRYVFF